MGDMEGTRAGNGMNWAGGVLEAFGLKRAVDVFFTADQHTNNNRLPNRPTADNY